ncbi:hypothetical protein CKF54_05295, partial [Psittacicella hinzii]
VIGNPYAKASKPKIITISVLQVSPFIRNQLANHARFLYPLDLGTYPWETYKTNNPRNLEINQIPQFSPGLNKLYNEDKKAMPLVTLATNNLNAYQDWLTYQELYLGKARTDFAQDVADPYNKGAQIQATDDVVQLLQTPAGKDNVLLVAGVITDTQSYIKNRLSWIYNRKATTSTDTVTSRLDTTNAWQAYAYPGIDAKNNDFSDQNLRDKKVYASTMALMCGVAKDDCLVAPYIFTGYNGEDNAQEILGVSFSTPTVAGIGALVAQQFPWMTGANLKTVLKTTAYDLGATGVDENFGWGLVNLDTAVRGPGAFLDGTTFEADLSYRAGLNDQFPDFNPNQYYFLNDIQGNGNLTVSGGANDYLYLVGNQSYTGVTTVDSGNLVLARDLGIQTPGVIPSGYHRAKHQTQQVNVGRNGNLSLYNVEVTAVNNSGVLTSSYSKVSNLTLQDSSWLVVGVNAKQGVAGADSSTSSTGSSSAIGLVAGLETTTAKLAGVLTVTPATTYQPTGEGEVEALTWSSRSGTFAAVDYLGNNYFTFSSVEDPYSSTGFKVKYQVKSSTEVAQGLASSVSLSSADTSLLLSGAKVVDSFLTSVEVPEAVVTTEATIINDASSSLQSLTTAYAEANGNEPTINLTTAQAEQALGVSLTADEENSSSTTVSSEATTSVSSTATAFDYASQIQQMNAQQLATLYYNTAGTVFANLQLAVTSQVRQANFDFAKVAGARYLTSDNSIKAYLDTGHTSQDWNNGSQFLRGNLQTNKVVAGVYQQVAGYNWGLAAGYANSKWHEDAYGKVKQAGVNFLVGKAFTNSWYNLSFFASSQRYEVERSLLNSNDLSSKFNATTLGLSLQAGYLALNSDNYGVELNGGLTLQREHQSAFSEKVHEVANAYGQAFAFNAKARSHTQSYLNLGVKGWYNLNSMFNLYSSLDLVRKLASNNYQLELVNGEKTAVGFSQSFLADLKLGMQVKISKNFSIDLNTGYQKAKDWSAKQANLRFTFAF